MLLFPAIDLKDQKIVRLTQGDYNQVTAYGDDPLSQARGWAQAGAEWLHVVDLDAARSGQAAHSRLIGELARGSGLKLQVGGGIRSVEMARQYLEAGVARVVVGTQAVREPQFLQELVRHFPDQVALGLDTRDGQIATQGWTENSGLSVQDFLSRNDLSRVACLIFTDIARDGMLTGPNLAALEAVLEISPIPVIASGGISELGDLRALKSLHHSQLLGVIVGKALYAGKFGVAEAVEALG